MKIITLTETDDDQKAKDSEELNTCVTKELGMVPATEEAKESCV